MIKSKLLSSMPPTTRSQTSKSVAAAALRPASIATDHVPPTKDANGIWRIPYRQGITGRTLTEMSTESVLREFSITERAIESPFDEERLKRQGAFAHRFRHERRPALRRKKQKEAIRNAVRVWRMHPGAATIRQLTINHTNWDQVKAMRGRVLPTIPGSDPRQVRPLDHEGKQMNLEDAEGFLRIDTSDGDVWLRDRNGRTIGYLYRGPPDLIDGLNSSTEPLEGHKNDRRGDMDQIHWAVWQGIGAKKLAMSGCYVKDQQIADAFLLENEKLIRHLSNDLEVISPDTARRYQGQAERFNSLNYRSSANKRDPNEDKDEDDPAEEHDATDEHDAEREEVRTKLHALCGAFSSIAINLRQSSPQRSKVHRDKSDVVTGYCMIVAFGKDGWSGGDLILWQGGIRAALKQGDVFILNSANWIHSSAGVDSGTRNALVLFTHESCYRKTHHLHSTARAKGFTAKKIAQKRDRDSERQTGRPLPVPKTRSKKRRASEPLDEANGEPRQPKRRGKAKAKGRSAAKSNAPSLG